MKNNRKKKKCIEKEKRRGKGGEGKATCPVGGAWAPLLDGSAAGAALIPHPALLLIMPVGALPRPHPGVYGSFLSPEDLRVCSPRYRLFVNHL